MAMGAVYPFFPEPRSPVLSHFEKYLQGQEYLPSDSLPAKSDFPALSALTNFKGADDQRSMSKGVNAGAFPADFFVRAGCYPDKFPFSPSAFRDFLPHPFQIMI
jgi:hypothetical protein